MQSKSTPKTEIEKIPEFNTKQVDSAGNVVYSVVCAYCGREVQYRHSEKPAKCPHCGSTDYRKPKTETMLFNLQRQYLDGRDQETLSRMYLILCDYAKSIIKKHLPRNFTYHYGHVEEKATDAANLLIENYLSKNQFKVENSFAGYLQWRVKEVLWNKRTRREEDHESLNAHIEKEDSSSPELVDLANQLDEQPVSGFSLGHPQGQTSQVETTVLTNEALRGDLQAGLYELLSRMLTQIGQEYSTLTKYIVLGALCLRIERGYYQDGEAALNRYYVRFGTETKELVDKAMLLFYRFIKEWS